MILAAQEFLILVQLLWNADLVAGGTKIRRAQKRFQECLFVELRLRLHQLLVEVLQEAVCAVGERIVGRLVDGVVRIAARAVDVRDGMARRAGDAGLRRGIMHVVEVRIVERAAEERHHVVAAGAPARGLYVAIALERHLPRLAHTEQIRLVVERAEVVCAVKPAPVSVFVAFQTVGIHHQRPRGNEIARRGAGQRRFEIPFSFNRADWVFPRML